MKTVDLMKTKIKKQSSQAQKKKRFSSALQFKITIIYNKNNTITCK